MGINLPTEVGPNEETVRALMAYLVGPLLRLEHNDVVEETPSESQQKSVAKQVHAAVVFYNYYHLNQQREKEFLKFDQFCKLAIKFIPSIRQYMGFMTQPNRPNLNDPENQLSLTEKAIMDACTISETLLEASSNISNMIKEWPVTKVAVFLIYSKKENCFLQFISGLWSIIEKDLYFEESGLGSESKKVSLMRKYDEEGEDGLKEVAFSAVKEVAGLYFEESGLGSESKKVSLMRKYDEEGEDGLKDSAVKEVAGISSKLKVLEDHVVYSLSQAKTATHFYIVQSTQSIRKDKLVPIQLAISRLQGPVIKKRSGSWVITRVVEYYYLLPYAEIISKWFSRSNGLIQMEEGTADSDIIQGSHKSFKKEGGQNKQVFSNNLQITSKLDSKSVHINSSNKEERAMEIRSKLESKSMHISSSNKEPHDNRVAKIRNTFNKDTPTFEPAENVPDEVMETENSNGKKIVGVESDCSKQKDVNGSCGLESNDSLSEGNSKGVDKPLVCLHKGNQKAKMHRPLKVYRHKKRTPTNAISIKDIVKKLKNVLIINELKDKKRVDGEKKSGIVSLHEDRNGMLVLDHGVAKTGPLEDFQFIVDAKRSKLSEAALRALLNKKQKLFNQRRNIEDELTLCEKKIQEIMQGGMPLFGDSIMFSLI